jgi:hypothetical protein
LGQEISSGLRLRRDYVADCLSEKKICANNTESEEHHRSTAVRFESRQKWDAVPQSLSWQISFAICSPSIFVIHGTPDRTQIGFRKRKKSLQKVIQGLCSRFVSAF